MQKSFIFTKRAYPCVRLSQQIPAPPGTADSGFHQAPAGARLSGPALHGDDGGIFLLPLHGTDDGSARRLPVAADDERNQKRGNDGSHGTQPSASKWWRNASSKRVRE